MMRKGPLRLVVTGGGTGGHVYPALSIAVAVRDRERSARVLYVGTADGLEAGLASREGMPFAAISSRGLVGKRGMQLVSGIFVSLLGLGQSLRILRRFAPHVVVGTGGYVAGPVMAAASLLRIPAVIQEQNVVPGVANRLLSRRAALVFAAYEDSRRFFPPGANLVVAGNPVRPDLLRFGREECRRRLGVRAGEFYVAIFMGSRGSATANSAVVRILPELARTPGLRVLFATGAAHYEGVKTRLDAPLGGNVEVRSYIHNMGEVMAAADLVVTRAGAITLAEITARGLPAILIPSPYVTHDHQARNAEVLQRRGAALVMEEDSRLDERLANGIVGLMRDPAALIRMGGSSRSLGRPDALHTIVEAVLRLSRARDGRGGRG